MVRGTTHPRGLILALPRYPRPGVKVKELGELASTAERGWREVVRYSHCYGRRVPLIPLKAVQAHASPLDYCNEPSRDPIACNLVERLRDATGVYEVGVTGSRLLSTLDSRWGGGGDIDVIVYGKRVYDFYRALKENRVLQPYDWSGVKELSRTRGWPGDPLLLRRELSKILQGRWRGLDVYIRLVPGLPWEYAECNETIHPIGDGVEVRGRVVDDAQGYIFPCSYTLAVEEPPLGTILLTSPRGRFCELLRKGDKIKARGRLELVRPLHSGEPRVQLVLVDSIHDVEVLD